MPDRVHTSRFTPWPLLGIALILGLILVACSPAPAPAATGTSLPPTVTATAQPSHSAQPPVETAILTPQPTATHTPSPTASLTPTPLNPLTIAALRQRAYPGSRIVVEQTLDPGVNYQRYVASYQSDGLKIYGLLTVPNGSPPATGWPAIVFIHGYIPPQQYRTTERYVAYVDGFARHEYIVFKIDLRGHGDSEGEAGGAFGMTDYTVDVLNAVASLQQYPAADPHRIGLWGHSMGGYMTVQAMVISKDIRAGVIWAGMGISPADLLRLWRPPTPGPTPTRSPQGTPGPGRHGWQPLVEQYGTPEENPAFWASISANSYLPDLSGPLQLHHSTTDESVPYEFSQILAAEVIAAGKPVEFYTYAGDNHNLSASFGVAMQRSVEFFDQYVKGTGAP